MVGLGRLELPTSRLSGVRSNQPELQALYRTVHYSDKQLPQLCGLFQLGLLQYSLKNAAL